MEKPEDYNVYFRPDGTEKECPYFDETGHLPSEDVFKARDWCRRAVEIKKSLMTVEERLRYDEMVENMRGKIIS